MTNKTDAKFTRAWLNIDSLPGTMMEGTGGRFGPVPGSTSCVVTTSERNVEDWKQRGVKFIEVFTAPPAASVDVDCLKQIRALLQSLPGAQGREHIDLGIRLNRMIDSTGEAKAELSMDERMARLAAIDPEAYVYIRGPIDQDGNSVWEKQSALYEKCSNDNYRRAVDHHRIIAGIGTAEPNDDVTTAMRKVNELIDWHIAVATDPAVNGGFKLTPVEPKTEGGPE